MTRTFGYIRVSTLDQNIDRQLNAMLEYGVPRRNIYIDHKSGKNFMRPSYQKLVQRMREDDLLVIKSIDRLGRDYDEILEQWRILCREKKVDIIVLDMPLLNTTSSKDLLGTFISDLVLQLLSFVAENERQFIRQRQAEGIAAARLRGVHMGRPRIPTPRNFEKLVKCWRCGQISLDEIAYQCDMSISTIYRRLKEIN